MLYVGICCLIIAMGVTWLATPPVIRLAHFLGAMDLPGHRKVHPEPVPRIGGVAVFIGFVAGLTFTAWVVGALDGPVQVSVYWSGLAAATAFMLLVGLADDLWGLTFRAKFAAQILAAVFVWYCGFRVYAVTHPLGGILELGWLSLPLTVLWIVGITNAINLIDGLDGLAPGIALITTVAVAVIAFVRSDLGITAVSVALAGALIGFLRFNVNPAKIFLGDSGSMFLGFALAVTSVRGSQKGPMVVAALVPLLVLGLPLLDTGAAVVRRVSRLRTQGARTDDALRYVFRNLAQVFQADRGHIHHCLLDAGMSHSRAVLVLYGVGTVFAACAFALVMLKSLWIALLLIGILGLLMAVVLLPLYLGGWKLEADLAQESPGTTPDPAPPTEGLTASQVRADTR